MQTQTKMPERWRRLLAIVNPISGRGASPDLDTKLAELARAADVEVDIQRTEHAGHATQLAAAAAAAGFDVVAVSGGDGTMNEVINGLGPHGLPLMLLPGGTGNALAREIGAPRDPRGYADALRAGRTRVRDLGRLEDGQLFGCFVGAGFEAECVRIYKEQRTGRMPPLAYMSMMSRIMLKAVAASDFMTLRLTVDGVETVAGASFCLAAISPIFGGPIRFVPHAVPDDGRFDILAMTDRLTLYTVNRMLALGLIRRSRWSKAVRFSAGARFTLGAAEADGKQVPYQVDGDFRGYLPIAGEILPGALRYLDAAS